MFPFPAVHFLAYPGPSEFAVVVVVVVGVVQMEVVEQLALQADGRRLWRTKIHGQRSTHQRRKERAEKGKEQKINR